MNFSIDGALGRCQTLALLAALKPGEELTFYKGTVPQYVPDSRTPIYDSLIRNIFIQARELNRRGKIGLREEQIKITLPQWKFGKGKARCEVVVTTAHIATGL